MSTCSLEEPYVATFWVLWYNIKVSDAERASTSLIPGLLLLEELVPRVFSYLQVVLFVAGVENLYVYVK